MTSGRWNLRSADFDVRRAARAAARRAGMSMNAWLEEAIDSHAARLGLEPEDLDEAEKIEAIASRLGALTLDDAEPRPGAGPDMDERFSPARGERHARLLDAAAARLGLRPEDRTEDDVARRISDLDDALRRRAAARRDAEDAAIRGDHGLRRIAASLFDEPPSPARRSSEPDHPAERLDRRAQEASRPSRQKRTRQEQDLHSLHQQIDDLSRAVAIIGDRAAKQSIEPALLDLLERLEDSRAYGVRPEALAPVMDALVDIRGALDNSPVAIARAIREEIGDIRSRMNRLQGGADRDALEAMRAQIAALARGLADLVARLAAQEPLQQQLTLLSRRVEDLAEAPRALADRVLDAVADMRRRIDEIDASPAFRSLEQQVAEVVRNQGDGAHALEWTLHQMQSTIDGLADHPELAAMRRQIEDLTRLTGTVPDRLAVQLDDLRHSLEKIASHPVLFGDAARAATLPGHIAESLSEIRLSVERLAANAGLRLMEDHAARLQSIEERVTEISQKVDASPVIERLAGLQDALLSRMDRLDRSGTAGAHDPRALQAIENQVLLIAERIARHGETTEAIGALERSMSELAMQVDEARQAAADAASAGRAAAAADAAERGTRATLEAVQETLEKVVDRLALIESDVGAWRSRPHPTPVPEKPETPSRDDAPPAASVAPEIRIERGAPANGGRQEMALEFSEPRAAQKSFIAAARRATQLMGAAPPPPPRADDEGGAPRSPLHPQGAVDAVLGGTSRKIVLGVAGVALAIGAYQAASTRDRDATPAPTPPRAQTSAAPAQPAPVPTSPEPKSAEPKSMQRAAAPVAATDPLPVGTISRNDLALSLVRQMARNGNAAAQFELASRLLEGRGMMRDTQQAIELFHRSAEQNYAPAQYRLGAVYEKGVGIDRSAKNAAFWYARAADAGHVRAMHNYGVLLADGIDGRPDYAGAAAQFRRAAEHGLRDSQFNLAVLHLRGLGVEASPVQAYKWFSLAGAQGDADALGKSDELARQLHPAQLNEARRAMESFALRTPDPSANEPVSFDTLVAGPRASAQPDPAATPARNKGRNG